MRVGPHMQSFFILIKRDPFLGTALAYAMISCLLKNWDYKVWFRVMEKSRVIGWLDQYIICLVYSFA